MSKKGGKMRLLLAVITLFTAFHLSTGGKMPSGSHSEKKSIIPANVQDLVWELLESSSAQHKERRGTSTSVKKDAQSEQRNIIEHIRRVRQTGSQDYGSLPTTGSAIESVIDFGMDSLDGYYMLAGSFIDTVRPGPLPYDIITPVVAQLISPSSMNNGSSGGQGVDSDAIITQVVTWLTPVLVVVGLGVVLALLFPLTGCCFCCWRCGGKCGAKNYKHTNKKELAKCLTLSIIFLAGNLLLLFGIILGFLSNVTLSTALKRYPNTLRNAMTDSVNYINGTFNEVLFLADDGLNTVLDRVKTDIQDAGTVLGNPLQTSLEEQLNPFINTSEALFSNVNSVSEDLMNLNETIREIESLSNQLNDSLLQLQEAIANLTSACMGNSTCVNGVPSFQATDVTVQIDTAQLDDGLATLNNVDINSTRALITSGTSIINNISNIIDQQLSNFSIPSISALDSITTLITNLQQTVAQEVGSNGTINGIIDLAAGYIELGDGYRYIAFVVLFLAIFLIWLVFTIGMLCGVFGYSPKTSPYDRSAVSNCGAKLLFLGVAICFVVCGLLLILTSLTFLLSTTGQKLCNDISPPEYTALERIADDPQVWGGYTLVGFFLQSTSLGPGLGNISANVSVSEILKRCEQNEPLYDALQVKSFFDINSLMMLVSNLTSQINIGDDFGSMFMYSSDDFLPSEMRTDFENLADNISTSFNLTTITELLNTSSIDGLDLEEISSNLTSLADYLGMMGFEEAVNRTLAIRDNLIRSDVNITLMALQLEMGSVQDDVSSLNQSVALIGSQVQQTFGALDTFLNATAPIVNMEVGSYTDQLFDYINGFVDYTVDLVENEVGKCEPLSIVFRAVHNNFCVETLNGLNGFWFSIGWCVLFLIPIVISAAMVTTYLRKSKTDILSVKTENGNAEVMSYHRDFYSNQPWHEEQEVPALNTPLYSTLDER
ncbi:prominin-1-like isoform X2 [Halichondria panicea]|uniref:prominin-1-like isoform X2 n=1 Tax=Halichondria panicea TaxID=6063 RepID=UPI00312B5C18